MRLELDIPEYDGWIEGFWETGALGELTLGSNEIILKCNREALLSVGKQCLYLYLNYPELPSGAHIHINTRYFPGAVGWKGESLVLGIENDSLDE